MSKNTGTKHVAGGFRVGQLVRVVKAPQDASGWQGVIGRVTDHSQNIHAVAVERLDQPGSIEFYPNELEPVQPSSNEWGYVSTGSPVTDATTGAVYVVNNEHGWVTLVPRTPGMQPMQFESLDAIDHDRYKIRA